MKLLRLWCVLVGVAAGTLLPAQTLIIGTERRFPKSWSDPEVVRNNDGTSSFKPSIPQEFETQVVGTGMYAEAVTVSPRTLVQNPRSYDVRLKNGTVVKVKEGARFRAGTDTWQVLGMGSDGKLRLKNDTTGVVLTLAKGEPPRPKVGD